MSEKKATVLVIDDEVDLLEVMAEELESYGHKTLRAENAIEALKLLNDASLQETVIHAILSDINMPQMTGLQMLEKMNEMGLEIPVIFISGYGDKEKAIQAMRLGAMDMLDKPYNSAILKDRIQKATQFGIALESLEQEVDQILEKNIQASDDKVLLRNSIKELLKMKKLRAAYFKS